MQSGPQFFIRPNTLYVYTLLVCLSIDVCSHGKSVKVPVLSKQLDVTKAGMNALRIVVSWLAIVGAAITLLGNVSTLLDLAGWVDWLVNNWRDLLHLVYDVLAEVVGIDIPLYVRPMVSFM